LAAKSAPDRSIPVQLEEAIWSSLIVRLVDIDLRALSASFWQARRSTLHIKTAVLEMHERAEAMGLNLLGLPFRDALIVVDELQRALSRSFLSRQKKARKGPNPRRWYSHFVRELAELAESIGIDVRTAGNRADDPAATPFTRFAFMCEKLMPEEDQSPSLSACARRIDRVLASPAESDFAVAHGRRRRKQAETARDK
jgi:hypothetical protein